MLRDREHHQRKGVEALFLEPGSNPNFSWFTQSSGHRNKPVQSIRLRCGKRTYIILSTFGRVQPTMRYDAYPKNRKNSASSVHSSTKLWQCHLNFSKRRYSAEPRLKFMYVRINIEQQTFIDALRRRRLNQHVIVIGWILSRTDRRLCSSETRKNELKL
jgi:ribosomal protein L37E